jgi:hypothetical protein
MSRRNQTTLDETLCIPLDAWTLNQLRQLAESDHRKLAQMGRLLLTEAMLARGVEVRSLRNEPQQSAAVA